MQILYKNATAKKQFCSKYKKKWRYPEQVKKKLESAENFIYELLDEAGSSILKEDDKLRDECINKFKGFIVGAGKVSASI